MLNIQTQEKITTKKYLDPNNIIHCILHIFFILIKQSEALDAANDTGIDVGDESSD